VVFLSVGKAYAIFRTKNDADSAISKINSGLVVGGRPLNCSKGLLKVPKSSGTFVGHLSLHNIKIGQKQREEQKKAVSTSHCSQPNTIEYDLALDWMLLRAKQEKKFEILHKVNTIVLNIYMHALSRISHPVLNLHVQSVCSIIKMPGKGLLVLAARPQRQETSWLVLVLYEMDFSIITFQSLVATPRTTL